MKERRVRTLEEIPTEELTCLSKVGGYDYAELSSILTRHFIDHKIPLKEWCDKNPHRYFRDEKILIPITLFPSFTLIVLNNLMPHPDYIKNGVGYYFAYYEIDRYSTFHEHKHREIFTRKNGFLVERTRLDEWI
ncbi:MAG: hypothetical protein Q8Q01_05095 [archaeon]|nr:hypothetical protein [archaeon]